MTKFSRFSRGFGLLKRFVPAHLGGPLSNVYNDNPFIRWNFPWGQILHPIIYEHIRREKPRRIMEVGVCNAVNANIMIETANESHPSQVEYYGFDLFDESLHYKEPLGFPLSKVRKRLEKTDAKIFLVRGDTRKTLPEIVGHLPKMDLILIDGGHSYEVCKSDWENCKRLMHPKTACFFHDYDYSPFPGVKRVVDEIGDGFSVEIINPSVGPLFALVRKRR